MPLYAQACVTARLVELPLDRSRLRLEQVGDQRREDLEHRPAVLAGQQGQDRVTLRIARPISDERLQRAVAFVQRARKVVTEREVQPIE